MKAIDIQKKEIRKEIKQLKTHYTLAEKKALSVDIFKQVEAFPQFQAGNSF